MPTVGNGPARLPQPGGCRVRRARMVVARSVGAGDPRRGAAAVRFARPRARAFSFRPTCRPVARRPRHDGAEARLARAAASRPRHRCARRDRARRGIRLRRADDAAVVLEAGGSSLDGDQDLRHQCALRRIFFIVAARTSKRWPCRSEPGSGAHADAGPACRAAATLGLVTSAMGRITLAGCRVSTANVLGRQGDGFGYIQQALNRERMLGALAAVAWAAYALERAIAWAKRRRAFGRPADAASRRFGIRSRRQPSRSRRRGS